jgi:hypothetical protein
MSESNNSTEEEEVLSLRPVGIKSIFRTDSTLYEQIMHDIRRMNVLSSYQIHYLRGVPKEDLVKIVELYNLIMRNVNEII